MARVFKDPRLRAAIGVCLGLAVVPLSASVPFDSAQVTLIQNSVSIGETKSGKNVQRPAAVSDTVEAREYLATESESRAELEFKDHSIVRVGQNTVFSFDANSRTLSLQKGAMLFYVPHGSGGGQIKTPSLTAAITGTIGKVAKDMIMVIKGEIKTPWGVVPAGWAIAMINGQIRIFKVDEQSLTEGVLYTMNGLLPGAPAPDVEPWNLASIDQWLHSLDLREIETLNPAADQFLIAPPPVPHPKSRPKPTPAPTPVPTPTPSPTPRRPR